MIKQPINKVNHVDLSAIEDPKFLATLNYKDLVVLADDIRGKIINVVSKNGGHLSSNLGVVEATIALHRVFDFKKDKLIFDVGHQVYAHKILTGRDLSSLRKKDGISGFQKRSESIYDCYEAGHSSTSISAASGFAIARDLNSDNYDVVAFIGDAAIASGLAFEGINNISKDEHKVIIVLNDNDMSISRPVGALGRAFRKISTASGYNRMKRSYRLRLAKTKAGQKFFKFTRRIKEWFKRRLISPTVFDSMGLTYIGPIDGHNIKALEKAFKRAKNTNKSVVVHICTQKGRGYEYSEKDEVGYWHGVSPFDIASGNPKSMHEGYSSWSHIYSDITLEMMEVHKNAILISPATQKGSGLDVVFNKFKDRCIDVGIAEEHAVTLASGLASGGYHPIISIYSTFMQRAYDEISHDLARMHLDATFLVDRSGLVGADGETHQGIYDEAYLYSIPDVVITMPSSIGEAKAIYKESFNNHGSFFIRLPRALTKNTKEEEASTPFGKWTYVINNVNHDATVLSFGPLMIDLKDVIKNNNAKINLVNCCYIRPIDEAFIDSLLNEKLLVIYDPYGTKEGFANQVISVLALKGYKGNIKTYVVPTTFVKQATTEEQLEQYGLLPKQIINDIYE